MYAHGIPRAALQDNRAWTFSSQSGLERNHGFFSFKSAFSLSLFLLSRSCFSVLFPVVFPANPISRDSKRMQTCVRAPRATIVRYSKGLIWRLRGMRNSMNEFLCAIISMILRSFFFFFIDLREKMKIRNGTFT